MKILGLETSAAAASAAVLDDGCLRAEWFVNHGLTHSQTLMPMLEGMMKSIESSPNEMDVFAVSCGPGSFTGLRIGIVTAKGMAYACGKKLIGIPTLDVLANNLPYANGLICPIMDARNNQVYTALYRWPEEASGPDRLTEYEGIDIGEWADRLLEKENKIIFLGDGVKLHRSMLKQKLGDRYLEAPAFQLLPRASSVAQLAWRKAVKGEYDNYFDFAPFYLRKSQAERLHG